MKNVFRWLIGSAVVALIFSFTATSWLKLRPSFYPFDVRQINFSPVDAAESPGIRLDRVLLNHLQKFSYINSFDHVFENGHTEHALSKPLWIDRCETTQKEFQQFVQWQKLNKDRNIATPTQPPGWIYRSNTDTDLISGKFSAPANGISYYDAYAYCRAAGGHLPYRHEWIAAASGTEQRLYAAGDQLNTIAWPYLDPLHNATQSCGLHGKTSTPQGIHDLNNNVSEWTQNTDDVTKPTINGGNAYNKPYEIYALNVLYRYAPATYRSPYVGFRCAYSKKPKKTPWNTPQKASVVAAGKYVTGIPKDAKIPNLLAHLPRDQIDATYEIFKRQGQLREKPIYVTQHEITRSQYADFMNDVFVRFGLYADEKQPEQHSYRPPDWDEQIRAPNLPVNNIDWWSAYAFANWAGGRLLSADEWALAASSQGRYIYPGTNDRTLFPAADAAHHHVRSGGQNKDDLTLEGLYDMGGNVSEWTQSVTVADGGYAMVIKGGNYLLPAQTSRIDFRNYVSQNYRSPTIGFRIAFDRPP